MRFLTREQVRSLDRIAIEEIGIPGTTLMENAGRGAAEVCRKVLGARKRGRRPSRIAIVAGAGNNGGDGFVVARHLAEDGAHVRVLLLGEPRTADAQTMLRRIRKRPRVRIEDASGDAWERAARAFDDVDLVVDGIFGTGLDREVRGAARVAIERLAGLRIPVVALDIPSGLDADTGKPLGVAVRAVATATFAALKRGLAVTPGVLWAGEITVVPIGVPPEIVERTGWAGTLIEADDLRGLVPPRPADGHKGTFGHLLLVAGSPGKTGAALLAAEGALRVGTGLATIAARGAAAASLDAKVVEVMTESLPWEGTDAANRVAELAPRRQAVVLGPGLGTDTEARTLVARVLGDVDLPTLIDADAISALSADPFPLRRRTAPTILTPHPGELARLRGASVAAIQEDRLEAARQAAAETGAVVILKGARSVVAEPDGEIYVNPTGGPILASGGTGDVLAGAVGGLLAQGLGASQAARLGTYLHGRAGDLSTIDGIDRGVLAREVAARLPAAVRDLLRS